MADKTGVLVVDDSAFMRKVITQIISETDGFYVVDTARDGEDALEKLAEQGREIQLVTLDIQMPKMDGLTCLKNIMEKHPRRVIMVSSLTTEGARETLQALEYGAIDFLAKPGGAISLDFQKVGHQLVEILTAASRSALPRPGTRRPMPKPKAVTIKSSAPSLAKAPPKGTMRLLAIASSTGGPKSLASFIPYLPADIGVGLVLVQHMPATFTNLLAERLDKSSQIAVREGKDGMRLLPGMMVVAPGGYHMEITKDEVVKLTKDPPIGGLRPCADVTFKTIASVFGSRADAVVLTGMGHDGTEGCKTMKERGSRVLVESKETALIWGMPRSVYEHKLHDKAVPIDKMADEVTSMLKRTNRS
jgi:two-component system chemotaxis response regulator CheB